MLESMGIRTMTNNLRAAITNASSDKPTNDKNRCKGSDSSYLPGGDDGTEDGSDSNSLEKVSSHIWLQMYLHDDVHCVL